MPNPDYGPLTAKLTALAATGTTQAQMAAPIPGEVVIATIYFETVQITAAGSFGMSATLVNVTQSCVMATIMSCHATNDKETRSFVISGQSAANVAAGDVLEVSVSAEGDAVAVSGIVASIWLEADKRAV
jgi:hypothetical protein